MLDYIKGLIFVYKEANEIGNRVFYAYLFYRKRGVDNEDVMDQQHACAITACIEAKIHTLYELRPLFLAIAESAESEKSLDYLISAQLMDISNQIVDSSDFSSEGYLNSWNVN